MKQLINNSFVKTVSLTVTMFLVSLVTFAQNSPSVEVNGHDVGSWFQQNWIWVAGGVLLLLLIIFLSSGGSSRVSKTTVVRDHGTGAVSSSTTTTTYE